MDIEYVIVADHAEIAANRLFLMGGGRDAFRTDNMPGPLRMAIAVGIRVGWEETNLPHTIIATVEDDDGKELVRINAQVNVGRPPELPPGSSQLAQLAAPMVLQVQRYGGYRVRVVTGEGTSNREVTIPFRVLPARQGAPPAQ
ncbi:MAG: hypothetical protein Kow0010_13640 [Dehalococcoidia bacterium]